MYQVGFDLQAVPSIFCWLNRSTVGTPWVAQTTFCSCSERSPAKSHGAATMLGIPRQTLESLDPRAPHQQAPVQVVLAAQQMPSICTPAGQSLAGTAACG